MMSFPMILIDFQGHVIIDVDYLRNGITR